ncbi:cupin [Streptomyces globisporus]|uniref:cupin n=1 Tax=Streptomyces sp. MCL20-2 TaxID=2967219 RepID=UPI002965ED04|nr:cupin [Streptomyces sp. MCL20-2]
MTLLQVMAACDPGAIRLRSEDPEVIRAQLLRIGVRFSRWRAARRIPVAADDATILNAYRSHIDHVSAENGYRVVDIRRLTPAPAGPGQRRSRANREKFRRRHLHEEDVVRFVVGGVGCHYLHAAGQVYALVCTAGDLLSVPSRTGHWFDAGADPLYTSVRFLRAGERSGVRFQPGDTAARFPTLDDLLALP